MSDTHQSSDIGHHTSNVRHQSSNIKLERSNKAFPIIGVGGIHSGKDAVEMLNAGASLVQVYTGFIYEGPGIVKRICKEILKNNL